MLSSAGACSASGATGACTEICDPASFVVHYSDDEWQCGFYHVISICLRNQLGSAAAYCAQGNFRHH